MTEYAATDPATGDVVATYPTATDAELDAALTAAAENSRTWPTDTTVADRAAQMRRVAQLHTEKREMLADIIVREMGKPRDEALGEIDFCAAIYEYYADNAEKFLADERIELLAGEGTAVIKRFPIGVLLGIMPWNFPYYQVARFACRISWWATPLCSSMPLNVRNPLRRSHFCSPRQGCRPAHI